MLGVCDGIGLRILEFRWGQEVPVFEVSMYLELELLCLEEEDLGNMSQVGKAS